MNNNFVDLNDEEKLTLQRKLYRSCTNEAATYKHYKDLDRLNYIHVIPGNNIELDEETTRNANIIPFLSEGVIVARFDDIQRTKYLYYTVKFNDSSYELYIERYERGNDFGFIWYYTVNVIVSNYIDFNNMSEISKNTNILLTSEALIDQYLKKNRKDLSLGELEFIERKQHSNAEIVSSINRDIISALGIFAYINYSYENCEKIHVRSNRNNSISSKRNTSHRIPKDELTNNPCEIFINDKITIRTYDNGFEKNSQKDKLTYHITSWPVRGHMRHYKNGKAVYIKPYLKGSSIDKLPQTRKKHFKVDFVPN